VQIVARRAKRGNWKFECGAQETAEMLAYSTAPRTSAKSKTHPLSSAEENDV
jgi:hypothetical protein